MDEKAEIDRLGGPSAPMVQGERHLRQLAAAAGFANIAALARAARTDRHTLTDAARGKRVPTKAVVERVALALGVDAAIVAEIFRRARGSE